MLLCVFAKKLASEFTDSFVQLSLRGDFHNYSDDLLHFPCAVMDGVTVPNPVASCSSCWQGHLQVSLQYSSTRAKYCPASIFNLRSYISENVTYCFAQMRCGWNSVHRGQSFVDGQVPQLVINDSKANCGRIGKSRQQAF